MRVLITGGLGQIGSHVAEKLLARGDQVLVIDNLTTGRKEHLNEKHPALKVVIDSIANKSLVNDIFGSFAPDVVVHAAASYKDPNDWYNDTLTNCVGGANIVQAATEYNVSRFIYFQTALCYGLRPKQQPITLSHEINPEGSSYAITKTTNEKLIEMSGLDYVTFRLANVAGPRSVAGPLPIFYQRLKENKPCFVTESRRDFVFADDLAKTVIKACDGTGSGAYHFSSGKDIAIKELFDTVVECMDLETHPTFDVRPLGDDDVFSILLDPSRTFEDFGSIYFTPLKEMVESAIKYYVEYGTMGEYTHLNLPNK